MQIVRSTPTSYLQIIIKPTHDKTVARVQSLQHIIFIAKIIYELIKTKVKLTKNKSHGLKNY